MTILSTTKTDPKAPSQRQLQVGELIRHALAELFMEGKFHSEELGSSPITVSEVRVSSDLRNATAFVMPLGGTKDKARFIKNLARLTPVLRAMMTKRIKLRFTPEISFRLDESFEQASHVEGLLKTVIPQGEE